MMRNIREDNGNCRVYFTTGHGHLYCWQQGTVNGPFHAYACSRDGEPSHRSGLDFKPVPLSHPETSTGNDFNRWAAVVNGE